MAVSRFSEVNFVPFEQALSSDLNRIQKLSSRDVQNILKDTSRADEARDTATGGYAGPGTAAADVGQPINVGSLIPQLTSPSGLTLTLTAGEGYLNDPTGVGADDSSYQVVRWAQQVLSFSAGGANDRIDLVYATPAMVAADAQTRNVLFDPVNRTVVSETVAKTNNPLATVGVVAGAESATPVPPAVPANSLPLFEVYVHAGDAGSGSFSVLRRLWRRVEFPISSYNGILKGCVPVWTANNTETAASSDITFGTADLNRIVIDGEVVTFSGTVPNAVNDGITPPVAAPANNDAPFYIYVVGGRNINLASFMPGRNNGSPFALVKSLTAPDKYGHPLVSIRVGSSGPTTRVGAVYVGLGWIVKGTTNVKACTIDGDMIFAQTGQNTDGGGVVFVGFNEGFADVTGKRTLGAGITTHAFASRPSPWGGNAARAIIMANFSYGVAATAKFLTVGPRQNSGPAVIGVQSFLIPSTLSGGSYILYYQFESDLGPIGSEMAASGVTDAGNCSFRIWPLAYNMNVPRLSF